MDGGASSLASPSSSKQSLLAALSLSERLGGFLSSADILGLIFFSLRRPKSKKSDLEEKL